MSEIALQNRIASRSDLDPGDDDLREDFIRGFWEAFAKALDNEMMKERESNA